MPAGEKTVAQRAFVEALVEAGGGVLGGGDRRQERQIEPGGDPVGHGLRIEVLRQNDPLVPAQGEPVSRSAAPNANSFEFKGMRRKSLKRLVKNRARFLP